ncbi:MAG TPA: electron transfer flavoprotein subunit beta/FixA family protein [Candidatus Thermoplasmatota archaeon]|nr:electron transfer flavoprotein subunit beta/FixA family protein [Candidatus Thermoplasmatota archaeon]
MTRIAVLVRMAPDVSQLKIDPATRAPKMEGLPWKVSDFDKNAVEAAVKLKEKGQATKVTCYTYEGGPNAANLVKEPLAMGCDEAVVITGPPMDGRGIAKVLAAAIQKDGGADLVFAGEVSIDRGQGEVGPRVAALLGMPSLTNVQELQGVEGGALKAVRDGEPAELVQVPLPAAATFNDEANRPRLPALMQILQAGKKPIRQVKASDLGVADADVARLMVMKGNAAPKQQRKNIVIQGADAAEQLVAALRKEGVVA